MGVRGSAHLESFEKVEDHDGQEEADDGHHAARVGDERQSEVVFGSERSRVEVHEHREVGEVVAVAGEVRVVAPYHPAAFLGPGAGGMKEGRCQEKKTNVMMKSAIVRFF